MMKLPKLKMVKRDEWLVNTCHEKRVLHIGCTDYPITTDKINNDKLLHARLAAVATEIIGLDIDKQGIETLSKLMPNEVFIIHSAEELESCEELQDQLFDVIVAADVIEHLANVGLFLANIRKFLKPGGCLLISTPQSFSIKRMIPMIFSGYEYVHPDHTAYYSVATLSCLLSRYGLNIKDMYMFQWHNPTIRNRLANTVLWPILYLSGGRLCDEIALVIW
jgi:2-polyprenyl-3-methyl-5-hydroxy-6-metoxy-1,4-benzoquinol methylase